MAELTAINTSVANPPVTSESATKVEQVTPPVVVPQTCASKNCINKPGAKKDDDDKNSKKKKKQKKRKGKVESNSESSDSDSSSSSSDSSNSDSDGSDSESSESEVEDRKNKKGKSKSKKSVKKTKSKEKQTKSSRTVGKKSKKARNDSDDESDSDNDSGSDSDSESGSQSGSGDESNSAALTKLKRELESSGLLRRSRRHAPMLRKLIQMASKKSAENSGSDDSECEKSSKTERASKKDKRKSNKKDKKSKETDSSKPKFKRLDEIWDDDLYDYRLKETNDKNKKDEWDKYIFTVRRKFDTDNHYENTVVDIRSQPLRECLKVIMDGVLNVSLVETTPRLQPDTLFLYLEELRQYSKILAASAKKSEDKKTKKTLKTKAKHLDVLISYLDKDYDEMKKTLYPMLENGTITFDLLWALYKPNTLAYRPTYDDESQPRVFRIDYAYKQRDCIKGIFYEIEGKYLDYDGENFGPAYCFAETYQFQGARKITSLPCYPLKYHQNQETLKTKLIDRGKKFLSLAGMNYRLCKGICYVKKDGKVLKANINGRVMVDPKTFRRINPNYRLSEVEARHVEDETDECKCEKPDTPRMPKPGQSKLFIIQKSGKKEDTKVEVLEMSSTDPRAPDNISDPVKKAEAAKLTFTEEEMLIASPLLTGFCFSEKIWGELAVSTLSDVQWNEGAFDSLVIPEQHKAIVKALVSVHGQHDSKSIDDVVSGKGKGLVAVLHGKPGLGKTLTCEAVSDLLKRPLYTVSAGDLGTSATNLELQLQVILDVAHTWGAVLLLDEADVFLEERSSHDVHRNALVSIFLRLLEYFQGILFLTTNRVETFDEAFVSRIHLSLRYSELTVQARKTIWKTFITKVAEAGGVAPSSSAASDTSSLGMPTPSTTSSTPNSGTATPIPSSDPAVNPPTSPTTATSADSIMSTDSDKTITLATKTADKDPTPAPQIAAIETITDANYMELARVDLNGRQIKNLVKTAQALALYEGVPMGMEHLRRCIEVGRSFEMDLKGGRGWEDAMRSYT